MPSYGSSGPTPQQMRARERRRREIRAALIARGMVPGSQRLEEITDRKMRQSSWGTRARRRTARVMRERLACR